MIKAEMRYPYLLFDADDTLFDFQKAQDQSLNEVFGLLSLPKTAKEDYKNISHKLWRQLEKQEITLTQLKQSRFQQLLALYPQIQTNTDAEMLYEAHLACHAELIEGAKEMLEIVSQQHTLYLISNGMPNIQYPRLEKSGIKHYFKQIFISEEIGAQKPSRRFFDIVFEKTALPKKQCLVIGDSLTSDIAGGSRYGIDTCYLNFAGQTTPLASYCVNSYHELIKLLKK